MRTTASKIVKNGDSFSICRAVRLANPKSITIADYPRFRFARREGWINKSIACLGMLHGKSPQNPLGWTQSKLKETVLKIKNDFPEMPGIGF